MEEYLHGSVYCQDIRNSELMCFWHHHFDLLPLESTTGLMEDWKNSSATFGVCPEIKQLFLLSVSGLKKENIQFLVIQLFQYVLIGRVLKTPKIGWLHYI